MVNTQYFDVILVVVIMIIITLLCQSRGWLSGKKRGWVSLGTSVL